MESLPPIPTSDRSGLSTDKNEVEKPSALEGVSGKKFLAKKKH